jgi:hypothetical protein
VPATFDVIHHHIIIGAVVDNINKANHGFPKQLILWNRLDTVLFSALQLALSRL